MILGAWWHSSNLEKRLRLEQHLQYADDHDVLSVVMISSAPFLKPSGTISETEVVDPRSVVLVELLDAAAAWLEVED